MARLIKRIKDFIYRFRPLDDYFGPEFKEIYSFLQTSRLWSAEQLREYKFTRLKALLQHAEQNVPYYQKLFKAYGLASEDIKSFEDYAKIPVLTKKDVQEHREDLKARNFGQYKAIKAETAGTSGGSTVLFRSSYLEAFRKAILWRFYNEHGFKFRDRMADITNPRSNSLDSPPAELDKINNELVVDTYHVAHRNFEPVLEAVRKFQPHMIWAHPNMIGLLAEYCLEKGLAPIEVPLIGTYALKFDPAMREICKQIFQGTYIEYYGNRENSIAAWGRSDGIFYEISEYCHFEIENIFTAAGQPDSGDLITTSLHNYAFPLIRYHSEDYVRMLGHHDPEIPYPAIELVGGRGKDLLVSRQGLIDPYILGYICRQGFNKIRTYQLVQLSLDEIMIRLAVKADYKKDEDEPLLEKLLKEAIPYGFNFKFEYVKHIPLTDSGKFQLVISDLAMDYVVGKKSK